MNHRLLDVPGGRIHAVEQGSGPLVLLVHGFPESWYSWRHQLPALAAAGYRAVAIDVRGYGRSSRPAAVEAYRMLAHVGDNVGVVRALGESTATIVGHDWGSPIAANSALLRPDVFTAAALLSVPFSPRGGPRPSDIFASMGGENEFYVSYFQAPGRAEAEIEPDVRGWLRGFYAALVGDAGTWFFVAPGGRLSDGFPDTEPPDWIDLDHYVGEFERTGLTGALNRYRNADRDWEDLAAWDGEALQVPSLFIGGAQDASTTWMAEAVAAHPEAHVLDGCGHWIQQQRPDEVNALLLEWLARS